MNASRPKVVHLTTTDMSLDWLLAPQLVAFVDAGYDVIGMSATGPHVAHLAEMGIRHVAVPSLTRAPGALGDLRALRELHRLLRQERPHVLHTHNPKPGVLGRIAGRLAGVPVVVNTQHGLYAQPTDRLRRRLPVYATERVAAAFGHHELVQSPEDVTTLTQTLRVPARKVTLLGNGVDLDRFDGDRTHRERIRAEWGIAPEQVLVGVVGRLVREKGIDEIVAAADVLRRAHAPVAIVVIGPAEPDKRDGLTPDALERARITGIDFVGRRDDMPACYAAIDVFLTATHREGFPRAAMEAAASGLPIVATDIRGCRQVVHHEHTGLLVPVRDAGALAAAVARLVAQPAERARFGAAAFEKARKEFDQQQVIDITLATYAEQLSRRGVRAPRR